MDATKPSSPQDNTIVDYSTPASIIAHGHEVLHGDYATRLEKAMDRPLPQMEVRVKNLSLSVQRTVRSASDTYELPTIGTIVKNGLSGLCRRRDSQRQVEQPILRNVSGVFSPGTMTLVLGQPGSGKSSLLKLLSGRFPMTKDILMDGEVTYNGVAKSELDSRLPQFVSYVAQRDAHYATLTVKETLEFAHACCGGAELMAYDEELFQQGENAQENQAALQAARAMARHYPEIVLNKLGLNDCENTLLGSAMIRGVSGGERKRVTIGEMEFGEKHVTLMDEATTGLDSAAAFDIVKTQRSLAQKLRKTVVMALLQPAPEVFELFDYVLILNQGHVLYHGPRDHCESYFASLGIKRPQNQDVADFLMDLGTSQQLHNSGSQEKPTPPHGPAELAQLFRQSALYAAMQRELDRPLDPACQHDITTEVPEFHLGFWESTRLLTKREFKVMWRNVPYIKGKAVVVVVIGLILSTLYYNFDPKNVQLVMGTLYPTLLFFTLGQIAQLPLFLTSKEIFRKQRNAHLYPTAAYVTATGLNQIPICAIEALLFGLMVFWLCGFAGGVASFLLFIVIVIIASLAFAAWFFLLAAVAPTVQVAQSLGMLSILIYILFAGFLVTHQHIPGFFIWAYWANPLSWAMRSLMVNQYHDSSFDTCVYDGVDYCKLYGQTMGTASLKTYDIYTQASWIWLGLGFTAASFVVFLGLAGVVLERGRLQSHDQSHGVVAAAASSEPLDAQETGSETADAYGLAQTPRDIALDLSHPPRHAIPVVLAFKDLYYSVPDPENPKEDLALLKGISGFAMPGTITALMGSSGAGKTTLMDVIAGRKTGGKIRGQILLNGHAATDLAIRRSTGYCEQMDIHVEAATFREALAFSAFLRQDASVPDAQKYDSVEEVLELLNLGPIADRMIRGSSVEQMKRLTIGVELAAQPSVLFLDEPTSGLDARSAKVIMDGVRKVADSGRTVVCTIHQPSAEVFSVFDSLLLLKRGGETVYFGELGKDASEMVQYFEAMDGVAPLAADYNPATWMLEVIGAGVASSDLPAIDFVTAFNASTKKTRMDEALVTASGVGQEVTFTSKRAASNATQARFLVSRYWAVYWRTPDYNLKRFVLNIVLAVVISLTFLDTEFTTYQGINAGVGMVFAAVAFVGVASFNSCMPLTIEARNVFYRERAAQIYNAFWFFMASTLVEIPWAMLHTLAFTGIFFPIVGFTGALRFVLFWLHLVLLVLFKSYLAQLLVFALPSLEVAMTVGTMVTAIIFLFMGYNPPASQIPGGYKWLHQGSPPSYTFVILSSLVFGECTDGSEAGCQTLREPPATLPPGITIQQYIGNVFRIERDELWTNFAVVIGSIALIRVLALLALRFINHQKK